jgi:hypothetical protein
LSEAIIRVVGTLQQRVGGCRNPLALQDCIERIDHWFMAHHHQVRVVADVGVGGLLFGNPAGSDLEGGAQIGLGDEIEVNRTPGRSGLRSHCYDTLRLLVGFSWAGSQGQQREGETKHRNSGHLGNS